MESTSPKKLRAELKDYLDMAAIEPIRIQRRSGENYILMSESTYVEFQNEISSLQRRLLAMNDIADGKTSEYAGNNVRMKRFKNKDGKP
jgi:PHD/YefM family antitoxin component YafN of YafNO toxin-antitoxin module